MRGSEAFKLNKIETSSDSHSDTCFLPQCGKLAFMHIWTFETLDTTSFILHANMIFTKMCTGAPAVNVMVLCRLVIDR